MTHRRDVPCESVGDTIEPAVPADDDHRTRGRRADYDAKDIQVLEGLDPVRKRPGMYVGSTGLAGLHHLIWEVVDNAVDEAMAGHCTRIVVTLQADGGCRVDDNGRGIPVDPYPSGPHKGKSAAEVVLTVLHAGGKFGGTGYKVSGGLHGVGVSVVNALSERLVVEVDRDGKRYRQEYAKGGKPQGRWRSSATRRRAAARPARPSRSGRIPTIFVAEGTEFVTRTVLERLQTMAFLNRGLEIVLQRRARRSKEQKVTFQYKGGLIDFVKHLNGSKEPLFSKVCHFEDDDEEDQTLDIAIQWNTGYYEGIHGYANGISTIEGGMHVEGFKHAPSRRSSTSTPEPRTCSRRRTTTSSARTSARASPRSSPSSCATRSSRARPRPSSATSRCARSSRRPPTSGSRSGSRRTRPRPTRSSRRRIAAAQARVAAKNARNAIRRKTALSGAGMPDKLKDCSSKQRRRERAVHRRG